MFTFLLWSHWYTMRVVMYITHGECLFTLIQSSHPNTVLPLTTSPNTAADFQTAEYILSWLYNSLYCVFQYCRFPTPPIYCQSRAINRRYWGVDCKTSWPCYNVYITTPLSLRRYGWGKGWRSYVERRVLYATNGSMLSWVVFLLCYQVIILSPGTLGRIPLP